MHFYHVNKNKKKYLKQKQNKTIQKRMKLFYTHLMI